MYFLLFSYIDIIVAKFLQNRVMPCPLWKRVSPKIIVCLFILKLGKFTFMQVSFMSYINLNILLTNVIIIYIMKVYALGLKSKT